MLKIKKLIIASLAVTASMFSASICASAAQIDSLSVDDNVIYAQVSDAENARLYVAEYSEGLLSDAFFSDIADDGTVQVEVAKASGYELFLWDKDSLAPVSATYDLIDGRAYAEGSETPVPEYRFPVDENAYAFNQDDAVMIVSSITESEIKGFKAGVETTYQLTDEVTVVGLSDKFEDVLPGSVVLIGTNNQGNCAAIELLASLAVSMDEDGLTIDEEGFKADYGVYAPSDGSTKYENIVSIVFAKSGSKITVGTSSNKTTYLCESSSMKCYRVGIALDGNTSVVSCTESIISGIGENAPIKSTSEYSNYVYLRVDTEKSKTNSGVTYDGLVTQLIVYSVPKELNFNPDPDDPWTEPFETEPIIIID